MNTVRALSPQEAQVITAKRVLMLNDPNVSDDDMSIFYASEEWRSQQAHIEAKFAAMGPQYTATATPKMTVQPADVSQRDHFRLNEVLVEKLKR